jgi:hypothetical protein
MVAWCARVQAFGMVVIFACAWNLHLMQGIDYAAPGIGYPAAHCQVASLARQVRSLCICVDRIVRMDSVVAGRAAATGVPRVAEVRFDENRPAPAQVFDIGRFRIFGAGVGRVLAGSPHRASPLARK